VPRVLLVGSGARESALALRLAKSSDVCAFTGHANPSLVDRSVDHAVGDVCDPAAAAAYARTVRPDLAVVSSDGPLEAGVVDALREAGVPTMGADRLGAQIEWDKTAARELLEDVRPSANPLFAIARAEEELDRAFAALGDRDVVVKPAGLTGGKGVKVMGPHLRSHAEARDYATELLRTGPQPRAVVLEERVEAIEFTIQAFTDGIGCAFPPATFDYPYRHDGDAGAGTGGMGCYTAGPGPLPFMTEADYGDACELITAVLAGWREAGRSFSGVLNSGFFLTPDGLKAIEFNARFGDPEAMNILSLLDTDMTRVAEAIVAGELSGLDVRFSPAASVVTYLVAPSYPRKAEPIEFDFSPGDAAARDCGVHFAACERIGAERYRTVGASRVLAITTTADTLDIAHARVQDCIEASFGGSRVLEWRREIGDPAYVERQCAQLDTVRA
jgi:phosphoribosylamine--glycine ligase